MEYPIVTGVFMWFAGLFASNDAEYLRVTALLLAPFGLLTAGMLAKLSGRRAFIWAAAPALVLYSVHNWDFLATATAWSARSGPGPAAGPVSPRCCSASAPRPRSIPASSRCRCCWNACTRGTSAARSGWSPARPASGC